MNADPARLVKLQVDLALRYLGFQDVVTWLSTATAWDVARSVPTRCTVYEGTTSTVTGSGAESSLLEAADLVLYRTRARMQQDRPAVGGQTIVFDAGVDLGHFDPDAWHDEPEDLESVPRPRIGYVGAVTDDTIDLDLLEALARELPWAHIVLVGDVQCSVVALTALPNVHVLGARPHMQIPGYEAALDVAILPGLVNDTSRTTLPLPIKEYLALGLPVVATPFGDVEHFEHLVRTGSTHAAFVAAVRRTLHDGGLGDPSTRRATVASVSGVEDLLRLVEHHRVT